MRFYFSLLMVIGFVAVAAWIWYVSKDSKHPSWTFIMLALTFAIIWALQAYHQY
jgi:uncharacterized protein (DUF983 family)